MKNLRFLSDYHGISLLILSVMLLFSISSCATQRFHSPTENLIQLEREGTECEIRKEKVWHWLWGMGVLPGNLSKIPDMFPDPKKSYRVREFYTTGDAILNVFTALVASVLVKTVEIDSCTKGKECLVDDPSKFVEYFFVNEKDIAIFKMKNGKTAKSHQVKIINKDNDVFFSLKGEKENSDQILIRKDDVKAIEFKEGPKR